MQDTALIVSPHASERAVYSGWLRAEGYNVAEAVSATDAVALHHREGFTLTVAELVVPCTDAVELIHSMRAINPQVELLMLSDGGSVRSAVAAMQAGAADVLVKPIDRDTLLGAIRRLDGRCPALYAHRRSRQELDRCYDFSNIVAQSPQMLRVLALAGRVAPRNTPVLITGESGTGKELLARAIHANSRRAPRPMVSINCATFPEMLLEGEVFGYRRGAFMGANIDKHGLLAAADGGTLFLDEVAALPLSTQAQLLRVLKEGTYFPLGSLWPATADVRVIAATSGHLLRRVETGAFSPGLYFELSVFPLHVPALHERAEDIIPLAHHFLQRIGDGIGKQIGFSRQALRYLGTRAWCGNVRELRNAIERAAILSDGDQLTAADFRLLEAPSETDRYCDTVVGELPDDGLNLPELNRKLIAEAIKRTQHNITAAARLLGLSRPTMLYRMKKYRIPARPERGVLH